MKKILIPAIVMAGAGVSWLKSKFDSEEVKECSLCGEAFEFLKRGRIVCDYTSDVVCGDCVVKVSPKFRVRKDVEESLKEKMAKVIVMKSLDVPGYEVLRVLGRIHSKSSHRTRTQAREDLLFQCVKGGGNCILEFESFTESRTLARSFQGPMPGMSIDAEMFMAEGILAEVKNLSGSQEGAVSTQCIQDLERISNLLERGHISQEEFELMKKQLLRPEPVLQEEDSEESTKDEAETTAEDAGDEQEPIQLAKQDSEDKAGDDQPQDDAKEDRKA